jgi:hypothetical protein
LKKTINKKSKTAYLMEMGCLLQKRRSNRKPLKNSIDEAAMAPHVARLL